MKRQSYNASPVNMEPLHIPAGKKVAGLVVYCNRCKTNIDKVCKENGKPISQCKFGGKHVFKVYAHVPGSKNERRTKTLATRNIDKAVTESLAFIKSVKEGNGSDVAYFATQLRAQEKPKQENTPQLLIHALSRYVGWLQNENVPSHLKRERSEEHIKDIKRSLKTLAVALKENGYDLNSLTTLEIDDAIVGKVYDYLLAHKGFAARTFNKYFSHYTSFLSWYSDEYNIPFKNLFEKVPRKRTNPKPEIITQDEYKKLLDVITPVNGVHLYDGKVKPKTNLYRPWLKPAFELGLMTGRRREELVNLKFENIHTDKEGNSFIKIEDYKVNRIQKRKEENEKKCIYIPLTVELKKLLDDLGYEKEKGSDKFILAPDLILKRNKVMSDTLSRGFSHYYNLLDTGRKLTFRCLRKTYITQMAVYLGGNARSITGHANDEVLETYYLNKEAIAKAANGFQVFASNNRASELTEIRQSTLNKTRNKRTGREVSNQSKKPLEMG